jgi:hypothetical protein
MGSFPEGGHCGGRRGGHHALPDSPTTAGSPAVCLQVVTRDTGGRCPLVSPGGEIPAYPAGVSPPARWCVWQTVCAHRAPAGGDNLRAVVATWLSGK